MLRSSRAHLGSTNKTTLPEAARAQILALTRSTEVGGLLCTSSRTWARGSCEFVGLDRVPPLSTPSGKRGAGLRRPTCAQLCSVASMVRQLNWSGLARYIP